MARASNIEIVLADDEGVFIRNGAARYRPSSEAQLGGLKRGETTRAWPVHGVSGQLNVLTPKGKAIWLKESG